MSFFACGSGRNANQASSVIIKTELNGFKESLLNSLPSDILELEILGLPLEHADQAAMACTCRKMRESINGIREHWNWVKKPIGNIDFEYYCQFMEVRDRKKPGKLSRLSNAMLTNEQKSRKIFEEAIRAKARFSEIFCAKIPLITSLRLYISEIERIPMNEFEMNRRRTFFRFEHNFEMVKAALLQNTYQLQSLSLIWDTFFTQKSLLPSEEYVLKLSSHFTEGLQNLEFTTCTDGVLFEIAKNCPHLKSFESLANQVTDIGVITLAQKCKHLQKLILKNGWQLTDASPLAIARSCINMQVIELSNCRMLTNKALKNLVSQCKLLTSVNLNGSHKLTDETIFDLFNSCGFLRNIYLDDCPELTNRTLIAIANNSNISTVHIRDNPNITDRGIIALVNNCRYLKSVAIQRCPRLTNRSFHAIGELRALEFATAT